MLTLPRTSEGKVVLVNTATGQQLARWPVDARELLATGDYVLAPVTDASAPTPNAVIMKVPREVDYTPLGTPVVVTTSTTPPVAGELKVTKSTERRGGR